MKRPSTIVTHAEPSLLYAQRPVIGDPISIVIVVDGKSHVYPIPARRALRLVADLSGFLAGMDERDGL